MKWLQLLVLFFFITLSSCEHQCYNDPSDNAIYCQPKTGNGRFKFEYYENRYLTITCENSPSWSELSINGTNSVEHHFELMEFIDCNLPTNEQLIAVFEQFRIINVDELQLATAKQQTNYWILNRDSLRGFVNITKLTMNNYCLKNPQSDLLYDLHKLNSITLMRNALEEIPVNFFQKSNLTEISSSYNNLHIIKARDFDKVRNLVELNLGHNEIQEIEEHSFDNLIHLKKLFIYSNKLNALPEMIFHQLRELEIIYLSSNYFSNDSLPEKLLENQSRLREFYLDNNKIKLHTLPNKFFGNLTKLECVSISNNSFTSLPNDLFVNTNVSEIILKHNNLRTIPEKLFHDCKSLKTLELSHNEISHLPNLVFSGLERLEELELSNNRLTIIQRNLFNDLFSLEKLYLENNNLETIEDGAFDNLPKLKCVKLSQNKLTFLPSTTSMNTIPGKIESPFKNATSLEELDLSHNRIAHVFEDWLRSEQLVSLDLSFNNFIKLGVPDIAFNATEISVDLSNNNIHDILLEGAEKLARPYNITKSTTVILDNNPLNCGCSTRHLLNYLKGEMEQKDKNLFMLRLDNLRCNAPTIFNERLVKQLDWDEINETLSCYKKPEPEQQQTSKNEIDKDKIYDAFISYSHLDDEFVRRQLVETLEDGQRYKLCIHYRDWRVGEGIVDQVVRSVNDSRRTIVVLSENFLTSEWAKLEFRTAHEQALSDNTTRLIIVLYGDLPISTPIDKDIKFYLDSTTYVKWGDPYFWKKLKYALPHSPRNNTSR